MPRKFQSNTELTVYLREQARSFGDRIDRVRAKYRSPGVNWEVWVLNRKIMEAAFSCGRPGLMEVTVRGPLLKRAYIVHVCTMPLISIKT